MAAPEKPGVVIEGDDARWLVHNMPPVAFKDAVVDLELPLAAWQHLAGSLPWKYGDEQAARVERLILGIPGVRAPDPPDSGEMALRLAQGIPGSES